MWPGAFWGGVGLGIGIGAISYYGVYGPGYYYAVQYAAAPLVVEHSVDRGLVIGNFTSSAAASAHPTNLVTVRDFGQGVVLFRQRHP